MSRSLRALAIVLLVSSCGGGDYSAPRDLENACNIVDERPHYMRAFRKAHRKYGIPPEVLMAMIHQESKFIGNARTPHKYALGVIPLGRQSSAYGYSQALDGTWEEYKTESGNRGAKRDDFEDAVDFMGWYMTKSRSRLGLPMTDARNQYLAYHEGHTGFARGSYNSKAWLTSVATRVENRAVVYGFQLASCR